MSDTDDPTKKYPPPDDYKTNPMLETILARINEGFAAVDQRFDRLEAEIREIKTEQKEMRRDFRNYRREITRDLTELEDRVEALENPPRT